MTKYFIGGQEVHLIDGELWVRLQPVEEPDQKKPEMVSSEEKLSTVARGESERSTPRVAVEITSTGGAGTVGKQEGRRGGRALSPKTVCIIAGLREELSTKEIVDKCGCVASDVYYVKNHYKDKIEYGLPPAPAPAHAEEEPDEEEEEKELSEDTIEQIQDLRDEGFTTTEIANELALHFETVAKVPARGRRVKVVDLE